MDRYRIVPTRDGQKFGILDRETYDYCGMPDAEGNAQPLEWTIRAAAEAWLQTCYRLWQNWEGAGASALVPKGWRPHPPAPSPFDRGYEFYN